MLLMLPGLSGILLEQCHIFCDSDQFIKLGLNVGYKLRSLLVSEFNKMKKTGHNHTVVYTTPGANFCPPGDIWRCFGLL